MEHVKLISTGPFAGIAETHQGCVAHILHAARLGLFTEAEADLLIDRVHALSAELADRP